MIFDITRTSTCISRNAEKTCEECYKKGERLFIEINTLDELLNFVKKYDRIVIEHYDNENSIEIYDDYRE